MKNLSKILRFLMDEMKLSESELARRTNVGQPVIHRILSEETDNPRVATLSQIANYFAISISQLIGDSPLPLDRMPGTHNQALSTWTSVPLLSWDQAAQWPLQQKSISHATMIGTDISVGKDAFALKVKDSTMYPRFVEGMILIADPARLARDRDFVILHLKDQKQAIFKQLLQDGEESYIKPLNPDFKTQLIKKDDYRLIARVVQAKEDLVE